MVSPTKTGNVLCWASDLDQNTMDQAQNAANLPFVKGHVALMPDAHLGYGATIGSVIPTKGAIIPSAVGVDIGCGMIAAELPFTADLLPDDLTRLHTWIEQVVPSGVGKGHDADDAALPDGWDAVIPSDKLAIKARQQIGSLGSGNHFVEVCTDERDRVWVVLHSGSRGIGKSLADIHIDGAKGLMARYFIDLPDPDLAYLVEGTPEFDAYIKAMLWAQDYAMENRRLMMDAVLTQVRAFVGHEFDPTSVINCHHNFTELEHHGGSNVWITRKGAIRARQGDLGVIPGSMGTRSYIVSGKGNPSSYCSCSHGAGRRLSRGEARRTLDLDTLVDQMAGKAWNYDDAKTLLDEDPRAYKDIDRVMEDQRDLVTIEHTLSQILNYKGT